MVVDDDPSVRSILIRSLQNRYSECEEASTPFEALNRIKHNRYDLVISDVMMPGMKGTELLHFVKRNDPDTAVIMVTGVMDFSIAVDALRNGAFDFITKPFDISSIHHAVERALEHRRLLSENRSYQEELEKMVRERTLELDGALREVEDSYRVTLEALATALDVREHETQAHSHRVREYTLTIARLMGCETEELVQIGRGALLHDVGKIVLPDSILLKPGKLTSDEWNEMMKHPRIGFEILESIGFLAPAAELVLAHQERWDGKGYPNRLAGNDIPLGARMFAVADTMDAMTSDRPYRKALSFEAVVAEVRRCSGTQFDPKVVEAFLSMPSESWQEIHDAVNLVRREHHNDMLCKK